MNKIQTYLVITLGCNYVGYIICKYSFLPICKCIANFFDCDYAVVALCIYLIFFVIIGLVVKNVKADITTETYYKHNFTPTKAIILATILIFFHVSLMRDTTEFDKDRKILDLYNAIFVGKWENNNIKELKNETNTNTTKNNDFGSDSDTDGMFYRD